jgi:PLP dependent protein
MSNLAKIRRTLGDTQLVAVSKYQSVAAIENLYAEGQRIFGESRTQELVQKYDILPKDIQWHFIGHLQTNKVRQTLPYIDCIHAIDSERLLLTLEREGQAAGRSIDGFLQVKIAQETTKYGFTPNELFDLLKTGIAHELQAVNIIGLMGMASNTDDVAQIRAEFDTLYDIFYRCREKYFTEPSDFSELSMGMSSDYKIAIEAGSTTVRIGSLLFNP